MADRCTLCRAPAPFRLTGTGPRRQVTYACRDHLTLVVDASGPVTVDLTRLARP